MVPLKKVMIISICNLAAQILLLFNICMSVKVRITESPQQMPGQGADGSKGGAPAVAVAGLRAPLGRAHELQSPHQGLPRLL